MVAEYYIMYAKKGFAFFENSLDLTTNKSICKIAWLKTQARCLYLIHHITNHNLGVTIYCSLGYLAYCNF